METPLTILYSYGLRGDLEVLPKLYSFLRQLEAHYREEVVQVCSLDPAQAPDRMLLLDLGDSCAADVWHCEVTGGRSTLVVLDGMGYDAARVEAAAVKRDRMGGGVQIALVDGENPCEIEDVAITAEADQGGLQIRPYSLEIVLAPADETRLDGSVLRLAAINGGQVGAARLRRIVGRWSLTSHEIHDLPRRVLPDPTISASVEFVISEARYAQQRNAR